MGEVFLYSLGLALFIIIFGTLALNRLRIIPVINFGTLIKLFLVLFVISFIILTFNKCSDDRKAKKAEKEAKEVHNRIIGYWEDTETGNDVKITEDTIEGLFKNHNMPELDTVSYEFISPVQLAIYHQDLDDGPITNVAILLSEDKNSLTVNDGLSEKSDEYKRIDEKDYDPSNTVTVETGAEAGAANPGEAENTAESGEGSENAVNWIQDTQGTSIAQEQDDDELESQMLQDSFSPEDKRKFVIGDWKSQRNGLIIMINEKEYIYDPNSDPFDYEISSEGQLLIKGTQDGQPFELTFSCEFYNNGDLMELSYTDSETGEQQTTIYERLK